MIKYTVISTLFLSTCTLFSVSSAEAQNRPVEGTIGLTASIQGGQTILQMPYWASETLSISPMFGIQTEQNGPTTLNIGVKPRFFQNTGSNFGTYIGAQGIFRYFDPNVGDSNSSFLLGGVGGGEFFLSSHFSFGVEGQLNIFLDDDHALSTGAAVSASYYF